MVRPLLRAELGQWILGVGLLAVASTPVSHPRVFRQGMGTHLPPLAAVVITAFCGSPSAHGVRMVVE